MGKNNASYAWKKFHPANGEAKTKEVGELT